MSNEPASAARLTAIAKRLKKNSIGARAGYSRSEEGHDLDVTAMYADLDFLSAHVETLERRLADALAGNEVLRQDIEDAKEAAQAEQTRALLIGPVITQLQRERDGATAQGKVYKERALSAEQENARLTADIKGWLKMLYESDAKLEQAEQQRDAAHTALQDIRVEAAMGAYDSDGKIGAGLTAIGCLDIVSACDAALAASAPQKMQELCDCCERPLGNATDKCPWCHVKFAAPAQETERGR